MFKLPMEPQPLRLAVAHSRSRLTLQDPSTLRLALVQISPSPQASLPCLNLLRIVRRDHMTMRRSDCSKGPERRQKRTTALRSSTCSPSLRRRAAALALRHERKNLIPLARFELLKRSDSCVYHQFEHDEQKSVADRSARSN